MQPLQFCNLGREMALSAKSDAEFRTVVNRLYYGIHHEVCCRFFARNPLARPLNSRNRHSELRNRLNDPLVPDRVVMARRLGTLLEMRTEADYILTAPFRIRGRTIASSDVLMTEALKIADALLNDLDKQWPGSASDGCECKVVVSFG